MPNYGILCQIMEYSPTFFFLQILIEKIDNSSRKEATKVRIAAVSVATQYLSVATKFQADQKNYVATSSYKLQ